MLSALALVQTFSVRASITDCVEDHRFCVFCPSVSRMTTLSRSGAAAGALNGSTGESVCQPICMPMVTLVLPLGVIASILALSAVQSVDSGIIAVGQADACCARYIVAGLPDAVAVFFTSLFWSRSITQPFHVLWAAGVQTPPAFVHLFFVFGLLTQTLQAPLLSSQSFQSIHAALTFPVP